MLKRVLVILLENYNNPLATMVQKCNKPIGEILAVLGSFKIRLKTLLEKKSKI